MYENLLKVHRNKWTSLKCISRINNNSTEILIDWFERHVNPSKNILFEQVRESSSLQVHIHFFMQLFQKIFWYQEIVILIIFLTDAWF